MLRNTVLFLVLAAELIPAQASECDQSKDVGFSCDEGESGRQFYFDSRMGVCQPFSYLGCGGNGNRFNSAKECKESCFKKSTNTVERPTGHAQWVHADQCGARHLVPDGKLEECRMGRSTCPEHHSCRNGVCCPNKDYVCSLRDDTGTFADGVEDKPRFAWSAEINSCWRFSYYGAKGNYNNFANFRDCVNFCGSN